MYGLHKETPVTTNVPNVISEKSLTPLESKTLETPSS